MICNNDDKRNAAGSEHPEQTRLPRLCHHRSSTPQPHWPPDLTRRADQCRSLFSRRRRQLRTSTAERDERPGHLGAAVHHVLGEQRQLAGPLGRQGGELGEPLVQVLVHLLAQVPESQHLTAERRPVTLRHWRR